ncbi:hypothetical protein CEXT_794391 [Caerostris extrusa]|uniref:Uncharacterized protein n=1 Tax=Caerostris extrusa TaxID=172846 RepID=A0AAV4Y0W5_CAEEX|nr:hypothetical protein CEXT_794391 [Caerostris extrusa]
MTGTKKMTLSFPSIVGTLMHITSKIALSIASSFHRLVLTKPHILPDAVVAIAEMCPLSPPKSQGVFNILSNIERRGSLFCSSSR